MGNRSETFESEFVDRRIRLAETHFVTVDHGVEQRIEVHQQAPAVAEFADVVGEHAGPTTGGAQIHDEFVHRLAPDELEGRAGSLGRFFFTRRTHAQTGGGDELADSRAIFVHRDLTALESVPRMVGVRSVITHHHLDHLVGIVVGETTDQVDRSARKR